jgi:hypothetical protein
MATDMLDIRDIRLIKPDERRIHIHSRHMRTRHRMRYFIYQWGRVKVRSKEDVSANAPSKLYLLLIISRPSRLRSREIPPPGRTALPRSQPHAPSSKGAVPSNHGGVRSTQERTGVVGIICFEFVWIPASSEIGCIWTGAWIYSCAFFQCGVGGSGQYGWYAHEHGGAGGRSVEG